MRFLRMLYVSIARHKIASHVVLWIAFLVVLIHLKANICPNLDISLFIVYVKVMFSISIIYITVWGYILNEIKCF